MQEAQQSAQEQAQKADQEQTQAAELQAASEVVKTVSIRKGYEMDQEDHTEYGEPIEVEVAGETVKLWPVAGQEGQVTNKNWVQMPISYYEPYMKPNKKPPDDIEVPAFLQWW